MNYAAVKLNKGIYYTIKRIHKEMRRARDVGRDRRARLLINSSHSQLLNTVDKHLTWRIYYRNKETHKCVISYLLDIVGGVSAT